MSKDLFANEYEIKVSGRWVTVKRAADSHEFSVTPNSLTPVEWMRLGNTLRMLRDDLSLNSRIKGKQIECNNCGKENDFDGLNDLDCVPCLHCEQFIHHEPYSKWFFRDVRITGACTVPADVSA